MTKWLRDGEKQSQGTEAMERYIGTTGTLKKCGCWKTGNVLISRRRGMFSGSADHVYYIQQEERFSISKAAGVNVAR